MAATYRASRLLSNALWVVWETQTPGQCFQDSQPVHLAADITAPLELRHDLGDRLALWPNKVSQVRLRPTSFDDRFIIDFARQSVQFNKQAAGDIMQG
jgi:hypothetical protein